ncbi:MAG: O-antigen ligase family protein [Bacteroidetes bacterium]|nr:O-antigen ligase family protein [Bacteroidota bacterium]
MRAAVVAVLTTIFLLLLFAVDGRGIYLTAVASVPLLLFALYNFPLVLLLLPVLFFGNNHLLIFTTTEVFALVLAASFLVTYRDIRWKDFRFPLIGSFGLYFTVLLVSTVKSVVPFTTLYEIAHYVLFIIVLGTIYAGVRDRRTIEWVVGVYLSALVVSTSHVIFQGITTGRRVFGFSGVMFVDYVSLGIVLVIVLAVLSRQIKRKVLYALLGIFFTIGSLLTQTRNTWLSTGIVVGIFFFTAARRSAYFGLDKRKIINIITTFTLIVVLGTVTAMVLNPDVLNRVTESEGKNEVEITETGKVNSSLLSRLFIWHTAFNAFAANPILGIGAYSFPHTSGQYYTINRMLYELYVEDLTPHQTFIAVATETGIIGLLVYGLLYLKLIGHTFRTMAGYRTDDDIRVGAMLGFGVLYCLVSMLSTDAWLWGHGIILFGFVLGLFFAHNRIAHAHARD